METNKYPYEVIIIGGSYAGMSAALALGRASRRVLVIDAGQPCNRQTPHSHNFLTRDGIAPAEIASLGRAEVLHYPGIQWLEDRVTQIAGSDGAFEVYTDGGVFGAQKLLLATGIRDQMPALPGFAACWGISILHCPYCHGYEVKGKKTGLLLNGEHAAEMAGLLRQWTGDLTLYSNGPATVPKAQRGLLERSGIPVVEQRISAVEEEKGMLRKLLFEEGGEAALDVLYTRLPFGHYLDIQSLGCTLDEGGYVQADIMKRTTVPGIYAAGDITTPMRSVAAAVAAGNMAGAAINREMALSLFQNGA